MPGFWNATSRVVSLIVVTGLFAAMWSVDGRSAQRHLARQQVSQRKLVQTDQHSPVKQKAAMASVNDTVPAQTASAPSCESRSAVVPAMPTSSQVTRCEDSQCSPKRVPWMTAACSIPLPADIAPGEYQAVSNQGQIERVSLTEEDIVCEGIASGLPARNLYIRQEGTLRWYFIRIEADGESHEDVAESENAPELSRNGDGRIGPQEASLNGSIDQDSLGRMLLSQLHALWLDWARSVAPITQWVSEQNQAAGAWMAGALEQLWFRTDVDEAWLRISSGDFPLLHRVR